MSTALIAPILIALLLVAYIGSVLLRRSARDALSDSGRRRRWALWAAFGLGFAVGMLQAGPLGLAGLPFAFLLGLIVAAAAAVALSYRDTPDRVRRFAEKRGLEMSGGLRFLLPSFWELHGRVGDAEVEMFALTDRRRTVIVARASRPGTRRAPLQARLRDLVSREAVEWVRECAVVTRRPVMVTEQELDEALELALRELSRRQSEPGPRLAGSGSGEPS